MNNTSQGKCTRSLYASPTLPVTSVAMYTSYPLFSALQVVQDTQALLSRHGYKCDYRGVVSVKGKGSLITYFVQNVATKKEKAKSGLLSW